MCEVIASIPTVTATPVSVEDRMDFLPQMFPERYLQGEAMVYTWMERLSLDYCGGYWEFYRLSNGGFFVAPGTDKKFSIEVEGNGFQGDVSANAAGVIASMFALCHMANLTEDDGVIENYHLLREYISYHPEASRIWQAID